MTESKCSAISTQAFETSEHQKAQEIQLAAQAKALSHPARVRIIKILINLEKMGGCLNSDLVSELGLAQSTVSEHLRILKQAGFITAQPMPPKVCYRANLSTIEQFQLLFGKVCS